MSKPPVLKAKELIKILGKLGFVNTRSSGSHFFFRHNDGRTTVVPVHPGKTIVLGLMRSILKDINVSVNEFCKHL
jgi:predicted RNA binding protein YcfA (HicA-like mRNA interferase family)